MNQLKCFVASAFGRDDVDEIYKTILEPLFGTKNNIKLIRVDLINHNKEITTKIIELINDSDFGIIDLTYARPSVYYEAGYLEGQKKPVIYIVKDDHFQRKRKDKFGNEIVHFDLSVKNIIKWTQLQQKLRPRINLVTRPIIRRRHDQIEDLLSKTEFDKLSLRDHCTQIQQNVSRHLQNLGFKVNTKRRRIYDHILENKGVRVFITVNDSFSQSSIRDIALRGMQQMQSNEFNGISVVIFCSIRKVSQDRIEKALFLYTKVNDHLYHFANLMVFFIQKISSIKQMNKILRTIEFPIEAPEYTEIKNFH